MLVFRFIGLPGNWCGGDDPSVEMRKVLDGDPRHHVLLNSVVTEVWTLSAHHDRCPLRCECLERSHDALGRGFKTVRAGIADHVFDRVALRILGLRIPAPPVLQGPHNVDVFGVTGAVLLGGPVNLPQGMGWFPDRRSRSGIRSGSLRHPSAFMISASRPFL